MRRGFTLIELMVVIVVIGILVALITPAVMRAQVTAKNAAVTTEIHSLDVALTAFRNEYGSYPPSRIVFAEDGDYSAKNLESLPDGPALVQRTLSILRGYWPRMVVRTDGAKPTIPGGWFDFNGNHVKDKPYILQGHECMVMFLGGVPSWGDKGKVAMMGFGKDPRNPFTSNDPYPVDKFWPFYGNRTAPLTDFGSGKLVATANGVGLTDIYGGFYAYFSAYKGVGYDPDDVNLVEEDDTGTVSGIRGGFMARSATPKLLTERSDLVWSLAPNPYTEEMAIPVNGDGTLNLKDVRQRLYFQPTKYQIISPGKDGQYGIGGVWEQKEADTLAFAKDAAKTVTGQNLSRGVRMVEKDNLTNFAAGDLD